MRFCYFTVLLLLFVGTSASAQSADAALLHYRDSLGREARVLPRNLVQANTYLALSQSYERDNSILFEKYARVALEIGKELEEPLIQGRCYLVIGIASKLKGKVAAALQQVDSAFAFFQEANDLGGSLEATLNKANYLILAGDWIEAEQQVERGIVIIRGDTQLQQFLIPANVQLSEIQVELGSYQKAIEHLKIAMKLAEKHGRQYTIPVMFNNLGVIFANYEHEPDSALFYFQNGVEYHRQLSDPHANSLISLYLNLGDVYRETFLNFPEAGRYYDLAFQGIEHGNIRLNEAHCLNRLALVALGQKDLAKADSLTEAGLRIAREQHHVAAIEELLEGRVFLDSLQGRFQNAYLGMHEISLIRDSVLGAEDQLKIQQLVSKMELEQKNHVIALLTQEEQFQKQRNLLLIGGGALVFLLLSGLIFVLNRDRKKQRFWAKEERRLRLLSDEINQERINRQQQANALLEKEVSYKGQRLQSFATLLTLKKELLAELDEALRELKSAEDPVLLQQQLLKKIGGHLRFDKEQQELELFMDEANQDFFLQLEIRFPDLSKNDRKLCALLKMGLNNRELATLLNINPRSVEMARYRLRKRLALPAEAELVPFLHQLSAALVN